MLIPFRNKMKVSYCPMLACVSDRTGIESETPTSPRCLCLYSVSVNPVACEDGLTHTEFRHSSFCRASSPWSQVAWPQGRGHINTCMPWGYTTHLQGKCTGCTRTPPCTRYSFNLSVVLSHQYKGQWEVLFVVPLSCRTVIVTSVNTFPEYIVLYKEWVVSLIVSSKISYCPTSDSWKIELMMWAVVLVVTCQSSRLCPVVVSLFANGPKGHGFKSGWGDGFLRVIKSTAHVPSDGK
jgi:hypothetical protein